MKKFLSVLITVTMIFSLVATFRAPTASAFPTTNKITLTTSNFASSYLTSKLGSANPNPTKDPYWIFNYFSYRPYPACPVVLNNASLGSAGMNYEVYKMGDVIYGYATGLNLASNWSAILAKYTGVGNVYAAVDVQKQVAGINKFSLSTGNVDQDGEYLVVIRYGFGIDPGNSFDVLTDASVYDKEVVYIVYNMTIGAISLNTCSSYYTITGWLTRGQGQTALFPVRVWVTYPNCNDAATYWVQPNSSGMFTVTFPADDPTDGDTLPEIGKFHITILDVYNGYNAGLGFADANTLDAIVYYYLDNTPSVSLTLSTYINPTILYKNVVGQPTVLRLVDQVGNPVDMDYDPATAGIQLAINDDPTAAPGINNPLFYKRYFEVSYTDGSLPTITVSEISKGFYRFIVNTSSVTQADIRFKAHYEVYDTDVTSGWTIIPLRDLGVWNPFADVNTIYSIPPYGQGPLRNVLAQNVYDKLPCTIGNALEIQVGYIPPVNSADWYVYYASGKISGPIYKIGSYSYSFDSFVSKKSGQYLITKAGKITASVSAQIWERVDKHCSIDETNACCHDYSKTFEICEVNSCTYGGVTLTGDVVDSTTVEVGKKVDKVSISIDSTGAPADLTCSCPNYIVWMYMVDAAGNKLSKAFTVDTYAGTTASGSDIWYNPLGIAAAPGTKIPDLPISFNATGIYNGGSLISDALKFGDCPFNLYGVKFNYPNDTDCDYYLVVKVFGLQRTYDACNNMQTTYPMIVEAIDPITILPAITELTSTVTITEGGLDPDEILMGVPVTIDLTDPGFTIDGVINWGVFRNEVDAYWLNKIAATFSITDTGWRVNFPCPIGYYDGYGNPVEKIVIWAYIYDMDNYCKTYEELIVEIPVVMPEFTVQIGLMDCDHTKIDNDGILTEGFAEDVYVTAVDPRGIHDFTTDLNWKLEAHAVYNDCGLPTSVVCFEPPYEGCTTPSPITVIGYDNPHIADDPEVEIHFISYGCADILVTTLKFVPPTVTVDPKEVPFTIPATATHVTFTVIDAHGHGASDVSVMITGGTGYYEHNNVDFDSYASGYEWWANAGLTGCKGEVDWGFVPPYSGRYYISAYVEDSCFYYPTQPAVTLGNGSPTFPCSWTGINTSAVLEAKYKAPVVDTAKPVVEASAPATVTSPMVTVTGKVTDNVGVVSLWIGAIKVDFAPDGTFSAKVEVAGGANTIKVVAFDAAGNMGDKTLAVTYAVPKVTVVKIQIGSDIMTVNGKAVQIDAPAEIMNGRTFLPLRAISEALGATVDWIAETQGITVILGNNTIGLQVGNTSAVVNGTVMTLDAAPYIKNNRTMVPFRVIAEGLGATVEWDPALRIVTVTLAQ